MNKFEILNKIGVIINELQDQYDYTDNNRDNIDDLELELFVANAHFLTDHIEILRKLNSQQAKLLRADRSPTPAEQNTIPEPQPETKYFEPVTQPAPAKTEEAPVVTSELLVVNEPLPPIAEFIEPEKEDELIPEPAFTPELLLEEENIQTPEEKEPEYNPWAYNEPAAEVAETTPQPELAYEPIAAQPVYEQPVFTPQPEPVKTPVITHDSEQPTVSINEMISAQKAAAQVGNPTDLPAIKDLKSAINLNDKLLFVRDLFNGYSMAYGEAIEILNRFNKFEEADQFLRANYYTKNQWEEKQTTADKFYQLLHRRFPA